MMAKSEQKNNSVSIEQTWKPWKSGIHHHMSDFRGSSTKSLEKSNITIKAYFP